MLRTGVFIVIILLTALFNACSPGRQGIDISKVDMQPVKLMRLDKEIFSLTPANIQARTKTLQAHYRQFYNRYISSIINHGGVVDSLYQQSILHFVNDKDMSAAYAQVSKTYTDNDIEMLEEGLTDAVKRYKVAFPKRKVPARYVTFMSGFNYNIVYVDSTIGIGLDMYLGGGNPFYTMLQWPQYQTQSMNGHYILPDAVRGWLITEFDTGEPVNNLLNHMIFYGKIYYATQALLPQANDTLLAHYTGRQMDYCREYEKNLWGYFVKDNKLYDNDLKIIAEYTNDGPFTAAISKECPPRIGMWIGWQIVRSYMEKNTGVTLEQLMQEKDAQKILARSKYKP